MHVAQLTPQGSRCSIVLGDLPAQREMAPGSMRGLQLVVADAATARQELVDRGVHADEITVFDERDGGAIAHAHGSGRVHPNFPDPQLDTWTNAYHGTNLDRLVAAKQAYDPDRLFSFPQAV